MAATPPREASDCRHGSALEQQEQRPAIEGYTERAGEVKAPGIKGHERECSKAHLETLEHFWSEPQHARLIDAKMVHFCFAYTTESALHGNMSLSYHLAMLGIHLATWFKLGKDTFLDECRSMTVESSNIQTILDLEVSLEKIGTERGLVLFLSKQIPCSCLDEDEKKAKQAPKKGLQLLVVLQRRHPKIGAEEVQPMQVSSVLFERVPSSRLESRTQEGVRNYETAARAECGD